MLILPVIIEGLRTRKDKTLSLTLSTNELTPEKAAELMQLNNAFCYAAFKKEDFYESEKKQIEELNANLEDSNFKTPSQRLRAVLFVLYKQNNEGYNDFKDFYESKLNKLIDHFKTKLL